MKTSKKLLRILQVEPLEGYHVRVFLTNGEERVLDLRPHLRGPLFRDILLDSHRFRQVQIEHGTLSWPTGEDLDPDVLLGTDIARRVMDVISGEAI